MEDCIIYTAGYSPAMSYCVQILKKAGFTSIRVYGDRKLSAPEAGEQRIYIKARKGKIK